MDIPKRYNEICNQIQDSRKKLSEIQEKLRPKLPFHKYRNELENIEIKLQILRQEKEIKLNEIILKKRNLCVLIEENQEFNSNLMDKYYKLNKSCAKLQKLKDKVNLLNQNLVITYQKIIKNQSRLAKQLLLIYPIKETDDKYMTILGICCPKSDNLNQCSLEDLPVALCYVTHILVMCSVFFRTHLRYPIRFFGSESTICDIAQFPLPKCHEFPLSYNRRSERFLLYGVYLLNKNIEFIRWMFGIKTYDLAETLRNLYTFLEEEKKPHFLLNSNLSESSHNTNLSKSISLQTLDTNANCDTFDNLHYLKDQTKIYSNSM